MKLYSWYPRETHGEYAYSVMAENTETALQKVLARIETFDECEKPPSLPGLTGDADWLLTVLDPGDVFSFMVE